MLNNIAPLFQSLGRINGVKKERNIFPMLIRLLRNNFLRHSEDIFSKLYLEYRTDVD